MSFFQRKSKQPETVFATLDEPFEPPKDYRFEPELEAPIPRPYPREFLEYERLEWRTIIFGMLSVAVGIAIFSRLASADGQIPVRVAMMAVSILFGLLTLASWIMARVLLAVYRRNLDGQPLVAQICKLSTASSPCGSHRQKLTQVVAQIRYRDPIDGILKYSECRSFSMSPVAVAVHSCTYQVGQYVTALLTSRDRRSPVVLYGFLGLRRDLGIVRAKRPQLPPMWRWFGLTYGIVFLLGACFAQAYSVRAFQFADFAFDNSEFIRSAAIYLGMLAALAHFTAAAPILIRHDPLDGLIYPGKHEGDPLDIPIGLFYRRLDRFEFLQVPSFWMILAATVVLGTLWGSALLRIANGLVDSEPPSWEPITIASVEPATDTTTLWVTIRFESPFLRTSTILKNATETGWIARGMKARAKVHYGCLGRPWIESISR